MEQYLIDRQKKEYENHPKVRLTEDVKGIGKKGLEGYLWRESDMKFVGENKMIDLPVVVIGKQNFKYINPRWLENVL